MQTTARTASPSTAPSRIDPTFRILRDIAVDLAEGQIAFPTFEKATLQIRKALDDPNMDTERLARLIASEPVLAAKLVSVANSAAVNPAGNPVRDVKAAVQWVGFKTVRSIATSLALKQLSAGEAVGGYAKQAHAAWRHCVNVAAMSYVLAKKLTRVSPDEALFAGVIHDIGFFYLLSRLPHYPELQADHAALNEVLREWHPAIGQSVLHSFDLSDAVLAAVAEHEVGAAQSPPRTVKDVVVIANRCNAKSNPVFLDVSVPPPAVPVESEVAQVIEEAGDDIWSLSSGLL